MEVKHFISDEFKDLVLHTTLTERIPFNFDCDFIKLHFGDDRLRRISYNEFSQLIHVSMKFTIILPSLSF